MEKEKIKEWYLKEYPNDQLGNEINEKITFLDVFETLDSYGDVYELIGIGDSVIRERTFLKLAEIMQVEYNYIYEQWLLCK